jgi:spermidine dehydrogenase
MKQRDRKLGMGRAITRRDFVHDVTLAAAALGVPWPALGSDRGDPGVGGAYYPPTRTGIRGSHPGSFETAHALAREGKPSCVELTPVRGETGGMP